jgi:hypothetical protein
LPNVIENLQSSSEMALLGQKRGRYLKFFGKSNYRHSRLLCARRDRPRDCRASNNFDEISPAH